MPPNDDLPHLVLPRTEADVERRKRPGFGGRPDDAPVRGRRIAQQVAEFRATAPEPAFDERRVVQVTFKGDPAALEQALPGVRVIAQEGDDLTVLLADDAQLAELESRMTAVGNDRRASYDGTLVRIDGIRGRTRDDRIGAALKAALPNLPEPLTVDVELWPHDEDSRDRTRSLVWLRAECEDHGATIVDELVRDEIVLVRVRCTKAAVEHLAGTREVWTIDLPPRFGIPKAIFALGINDVGEILRPPADAPGIVVLDTGLSTNHPLIAPAVGDAQTYLATLPSTDGNGHGTAVAGVALYGDVEACAVARSFVPRLRIHSGRLLDDNAEASDDVILESALVRAVAYFVEHYRCRVFVLAYGDPHRPYTGGRVGRIASVLDALSRQHGVLFVVPTGNFVGAVGNAPSWRADYPSYLEGPRSALLDPAPSVCALTVGGLAHHEVSGLQANLPHAVVAHPVARSDEPSPFTRHGPGVRAAIKPELVAHAGNLFEQHGTVNVNATDLGVVSTRYDFVSQMFTRQLGTSFAAPAIAHQVGRVLAEYPDATPDLARALLAAHAEVPAAATALWQGRSSDLRDVVGYGRPNLGQCLASSNRRVALLAEETIPANQAHFFAVPLPEDFLGGAARRPRRIRVALAFTPWTRSTRIGYIETPLDFRLVRARNVDEVERAFRKREDGRETDKAIQEPTGTEPSSSSRSGGTLQAATWTIRQVDSRWREKKPFVVVRRLEQNWSRHDQEALAYALAIVIEDATNEEARLHEQLRASLQERSRTRVRLRG